jgi:Protein of unknown function (DUF4058)/Protein of unknown function (DUF2934)
MPSPFPGMDPYLEAAGFWPVFQQTFIVCFREVLQPGLADVYQARVHERRYDAQGEHREEYIEIVHRSNDQLVTLLELASPMNKTTAAGREAYGSTRQQARAAGASIVEIDLVLQGQPMLEYSRDGLPTWDYAVTVSRAAQPERYEIYTATLQKRLPRFKVPLASTDRDMVLDLQSILGRCYDRADFGGQINYRDVPAFLHDRIAIAAYYLWQQEGCPHGRDQEHWNMAVEQLRSPTEVK